MVGCTYIAGMKCTVSINKIVAMTVINTGGVSVFLFHDGITISKKREKERKKEKKQQQNQSQTFQFPI